MKTNKALVQILNGLIYLNMDRTDGYERASRNVDLPVLPSVSQSLKDRAHDSRVFRNELSNSVIQLGGKPIDISTFDGRFGRFWYGLKAVFSPELGRSIFELPEYGDKTIIKAYEKALEPQNLWPKEIYAMLNRQWASLRREHEIIPYRYNPSLLHTSGSSLVTKS